MDEYVSTGNPLASRGTNDQGRPWKSLLTRPATNRSLSEEGVPVEECSTWESALRMFKPLLRPSLSHLVTILSPSSQFRSAFIEEGNGWPSTSTLPLHHPF